MQKPLTFANTGRTRTWAGAALLLALAVGCTDDNLLENRNPVAPESPSFAGTGINQNDFEQCSTGNPRGTSCEWINGVLNATHNVYFEGDVIPQKLILHGASASADNSMTISYGVKKQANGNYDFLARYDAGTGPSNPCSDTQAAMNPFCTSGSLKNATGEQDSLAFPAPTQGSLSTADFNKISAAFARYLNVQQRSAQLVMVGGTFTNVAAPKISVATYSVGGTAQQPTLEATVTFKFRANATFGGEVLLLWGAHFASEIDWGTGFGAAGQSGAPFHTVLQTYNGASAGGKALNVMGDVIQKTPKARISISPLTATNGITEAHTFTVKVEKDLDDGNGFVGASGEHVAFTLTDAASAVHVLDAATSTCDNAGANTSAQGTCTIVFTSNTTGTVTAHATAAITVLGTTFNLATDGTGQNSGDAVKTFIDGTLTWIKHDGAGALLGGAVFTVCRTENYVSATTAFTNITDVCSDVTDNSAPDTDADAGEFKLVNLILGKYTVKEKTAPTGYSLDPDTENATITTATEVAITTAFVDPQPGARIKIEATATNGIGEPHTFTVTLEKDLGAGGGFVAANGEHVDVTLTDASGASSVIDAAASTCDNAAANTDANGKCTLKFTSATAGTVTGHASATLTVNGVSVSVNTDGNGNNSGDAVKTFIEGTLTWIKHDGAGALLGGAVFTVCRTEDYVSATSTYANITDVCQDVTDNSAPDTDPTAGEFQLEHLILGKYTVKEKTPPTGYNLDPDTENATVITATSVAIATAFVDPRPAAKISISPTATNGIGESHTFTVTLLKDLGAGGGFVAASGEHVDFTLTNGTGAAYVLDANTSTCDDALANTDAAGKCTIKFSSATAGTVTGHASATLKIGTPEVTVSVATDGNSPNSADAVKTFVDGFVTWTKVDGNLAPLGGATFRLCETKDYVTASDQFVDKATADCKTVADNGATDANSTAGAFKVEHLPLGEYTLTETVAPAGFLTSSDIKTIQLKTTQTSNSSAIQIVNNSSSVGRLAPTQTTCQDFRDAPDAAANNLTELLAGLKGNKINSVSPGVFFYYTKVSVQPGSFALSVDQSNNGPSGWPDFPIQQSQAFLYDLNCVRVADGALSAGDTQASFSGTNSSADPLTYIIGIKYTPDGVKGLTLGNLQIKYTYRTLLGTTQIASDSLTLKKK